MQSNPSNPSSKKTERRCSKMALSVRTLVQLLNILAMHHYPKVLGRLLKEEANKCSKAYSHLNPDAKETVDDVSQQKDSTSGS